MTLQFTPQNLKHLDSLAHNSVMGKPTEYDAYGVITEAFILHKQPQERYSIFPQLYLPWNPNTPTDARGSIPDFGIGRYYDTFPHVRLQGGVEVKRVVKGLAHLPTAADAAANKSLQREIHVMIPQATDQAKAAVKGGLLPHDKRLTWLLFVGPYFTSIEFGPFTKEQLQTRGHKPNDSGDWLEAIKILQSKEEVQTYSIFLLGTPDAAAIIEQFLASTQAFL